MTPDYGRRSRGPSASGPRSERKRAPGTDVNTDDREMVTVRTKATLRAGLVSVALAAAAVFGGASVAQAAVVLGEDFEAGAAGWTMDGIWHVKDHPESVSVAPAINPTLVTLPDSGQLPSAAGGTHAAWYGEDGSGTFCTGYTSVTQSAKNGCKSSAANDGRLVSPSFSLVGAASAQLVFSAWWEIEAVAADNFDLMKVQYSVDGGSTWIDVGELNPVNNPAGEHHQSYSNNGLEASPSWRGYVASLSAAVGESDVRVSFQFDTVDTLYQGFRGLLIDDVSVSTPFTEGAPQISGLDPTCVSSTATNQVVAVAGAHFVLGSKLTLDGTEVTNAATLSSTRMEFSVSNLAAGNHVVQVTNTEGDASNTATLTSAASCAPQPVAPPGPVTDTRRTTATQVICNRGPNPGDNSVCTATVGDSDAPPRTTPAGKVTFTTSTGAFVSGSTCQLKPTPSSPGVASCQATYTPAAGSGFPAVTATYEGDKNHRGSQGSTSFIVAAPPGGGSDPSAPPVDPSQCASVLAGAGSRAKARIYNEAARVPESQRGISYCAWYITHTGWHHGVNLVGQGFTLVLGTAVGIALPVGGGVLGGETTGPGGAVLAAGTGLAMDKEYVYPATAGTMKAIGDAQSKALQDPPDPKFKTVVDPERTKVPRLRAHKGLGPRTAASLTRLVREMVRVQNLARATAATIDKLGGAKIAGDEKWIGVQARAFIRYSQRLAAGLDRLVELQKVAGTRAKHNRLLSKATATRKQIALRLERKARGGFSKQERQFLHEQFGLSDADVEKLRTSLRTTDPARLPRTVAGMLRQRNTIEAYQVASAAFKAMASLPTSVVHDAARGSLRVSTSGLSVASRSLRYVKGRIAVQVRCGATATGSPCGGTLSIRKGKTVLGSRRFAVGEALRGTVSVRPTKRGRRSIAGARRHKVTVVFEPTSGASLAKRLNLRR